MSRSREHFQFKAPSHPHLEGTGEALSIADAGEGKGRETGAVGVGSRWSKSDSVCVDDGRVAAGDLIVKLPASRHVTGSRASPSFLSSFSMASDKGQ